MGNSDDCCCTLCYKLAKLILLLGTTVFVFWLIFRPHQIRAQVDAATLSQFTISNSTFDYALTLNLSFRNPNRRIGVYYDRLEATAFYSDSSLGPANDSLPVFFQHKKTTTVVPAVFQGRSTGAATAAAAAAEAYAKEKGEGFFNLDVKVKAKLRYKVWFVKVHGFRPKIDCRMRIPAPTNGTSGQLDAVTGCNVDY